ncbi:uncharacterized protein MELLADRAFT_102323 [Melampsora larici-populina 98AG31]|uniref:C2H2-type domain-containing protein n=1 Tax=Melampsora larici-populina (strain 98AG31 / pathotype 3-4-7) TaxID=747676 RepID=F4R7X4_MELLP|nr:uncharacterized protein MELLADRAFT_102323 [Melampsora larici-populina 98AG31]EGG11395.1 hypothetical protein MELLADRAFT_102323 [Melampsora larici-populina 98AG31]
MDNTNFNAAGSASGAQERLGTVQADTFSDSSDATGQDGLWGSEDEDKVEKKDQDASGSFQSVSLALPTRSAPPLALPARNVIPLPARATSTTQIPVHPTQNPSQSQFTSDLQIDFILPVENTNLTIPDIPVPSSNQYPSHPAPQDPRFFDYIAPLPNTSNDIPAPQQQQQEHFIDPALLSSDFTGPGSLDWFYQFPTPNYIDPTAAPSNDIPVPPLSHYQEQPQFINPGNLLLNPNGAGSPNWPFNPCTNQQHYSYTNPTPGAGPPVASTSQLPASSSSRKRGRKASETEKEPQTKKVRQRDPDKPKMQKAPCPWPGCGKMIVIKNMQRHIEGLHLGKKKVVCRYPDCKKKLAWEGDRIRHYRTVHRGQPRPPDKTPTPSPEGTPPLDGPYPPRGPPSPPPPPPGASGIAAF